LNDEETEIFAKGWEGGKKRKEEKVGNDKMTKSIGNCHIIVKTCCETQTTIAVTGATQKETKTI
jgi:hypothetical protein